MRSDFTIVAATALLASSASAATHKILVGQSGLTFSPNSTTAAVGDDLEFHFYPKNHDVVQGPFGTACASNATAPGFYSGFVPSTAGEGASIFTVKVNDTKPIWYFCSQKTHCQSGMVGVINPPATGANTLEAYLTASKATTASTKPGAVGGGVLSANSASGTNATSTDSASKPSGTSGAVHVRALNWVQAVGITTLVGGVAAFML